MIIKTKIHAVEMYRNNGDIEYTCRKYHISRYSLWRWNKKYDGAPESLEDKSHKPKTRHPNAHSNQEIRWIRNYVKGKAYLKRSNNIPMAVLGYLTPKEKRAELEVFAA